MGQGVSVEGEIVHIGWEFPDGEGDIIVLLNNEKKELRLLVSPLGELILEKGDIVDVKIEGERILDIKKK